MKKTNDGYLMLLDAIVFNGKVIGYVSEDGVDWSGDSAEQIKIHVAQKRTSPVKKITKKAATNIIKFTMIELVPENCVAILGGEISGDEWKAPAQSIEQEGEMKIVCGTGQTISIKKVAMTGAIRGKIGGDTPLGIETEAEILLPEDGSSPFSIMPTVPYIKATPDSVSFVKGGGTKEVAIDASGEFTVSQSPAGYSVQARGNKLVITASNNTTSAPRNGSITLTLREHSEVTKQITLTQAQ